MHAVRQSIVHQSVAEIFKDVMRYTAASGTMAAITTQVPTLLSPS